LYAKNRLPFLTGGFRLDTIIRQAIRIAGAMAGKEPPVAMWVLQQIYIPC
jgi:hypothetical protein